MRTGTFSDARAADFVSANFVSVWRNIRPVTKFADGLYPKAMEAAILLATKNGDATDNLSTFVCRPSGTILHVVPGYWKPDEWLRELEFGRGLASSGDVSGALRARRMELAGSLGAAVDALLARPGATLGWTLQSMQAGLR